MIAQWPSGRVLDSRPRGRGFEPLLRRCVVSLSKNINPSLELVQPRKTRLFIAERLLMGRKETNQTNKIKSQQQSSQKLWKLWKITKKVPCMEKLWNLKNLNNPGKITEFCEII